MILEDITKGKYYHTTLVATLRTGKKVAITLNCSDYEPEGDSEPSYRELNRNYEGSREIFAEECTNGHYERASTRLVADIFLATFREPPTRDDPDVLGCLYDND